MAEEKPETKPAEAEEAGKEEKGGEPAAKGGKKSKLLLIVAPIAAVALAAGGYFGYTLLSQGKGKGAPAKAEAAKQDGKVVLFSVDPFVVNLSEPGRYLKVTMQFELAGGVEEKAVVEKVPILRDAVITLIGNQAYDYVASTEGKIQLKDEILLRTNRLFGKEVFRNLYFTDFVMQ
ncbi:MAG: flagellar basal body-associated FliL family protein [Thermodesulfobacteriota bacterium]